MNLNEFVKQAYELSLEKGWWSTNRSYAESVMMIITELAESVQEHRTNGESDKWREELADTYIRLNDLIGKYNIDIEKEITRKHNINKKREYRHGKSY